MLINTKSPMFLGSQEWGGWAFHLNSTRGNYIQGIRSGFAQGLFSAFMTFYFSHSVLFFYQRAKNFQLWWLLPTMGTLGHTGPALVSFHTINGTPNILTTV